MTLIRDGFNPEELQTYLRRRQADDAQQMKKVINHLRTWAGNKPLIKAFHSWKEFVGLKKSIKSALLKIFQSSSGLDWCWAKWKAKDTAFEQVLWKESRKQML